MTNQICFKHNNWWVYSEFKRDDYTAWGCKAKTPALFPPDHDDATYFQFGDTRKEAIDKLIIELDEVDKMVNG